MRTLAAIQHAVLEVIRSNPGIPINGSMVAEVGRCITAAVGRLDAVRVGVAAGQLQERGLLRCWYDEDNPDQFRWVLTHLALEYLD